MTPRRCPGWIWDGVFGFFLFQPSPQRVGQRGRGKAAKAAHAKTRFSLFPSRDRLENFPSEAYCTEKLWEKQPKKYEVKPPSPPQTLSLSLSLLVQIIKKKLSRRKRKRLELPGKAAVGCLWFRSPPTPRQIRGKSTANPPPRGPAGTKNWMQKDVQSVLIPKHSKAS